jgi:tRNA modification GTPase
MIFYDEIIHMADTIVALATPTGRSGIGVIRLSGDDALGITARLIGESGATLLPRHAHLKSLIDPATQEVIDDAVCTWFRRPRSFTGEDVVEISCHGSPVVLRRVIDICLAAGARLAGPGEFTLRAISNGRMDLTVAEAVRDLIDAQTSAAARQAVRQMHGEMSATLQPVKDDLLDVIVILESALEFVEDDLPDVQLDSIRQRMRAAADAVGTIADTFKAGHLIRDGLRVAIVGRPNVGKSSLFNVLLGTDRAIVTEIAGTTRDQLHERLIVDNIPISLIDTAGMRETSDTVESIGVARSKAVMSDADLVLVVLDASEEMMAEDLDIIDAVADIEHLIVLNKIDKADPGRVLALREGLPRERSVAISAVTGEGLADLKASLIEPFAVQDASVGFLVTDARHHDLLVRARDEIGSSIVQLHAGQSEEIVLVGLHNALRYLGEITGETTTEDMLTRIFSTFCIGK